MKVLILDAGFINSCSIGRCKNDYGVDAITSLRKRMDFYKDAVGLTQAPDFFGERYGVQPPLPAVCVAVIVVFPICFVIYELP
jgi:hypothetical protein